MSGEPKTYKEKLEARRANAAASPAPAVASNVAVIGTAKPAANDAGNGDGEKVADIARRQQRVRLNLIFKGGKELSLPYIHLMPVELDGEHITLSYPWYTVTLKGRNLVKLKRRLDLQIHGTIREVDVFADGGEEKPKAYAVYEIKIVMPEAKSKASPAPSSGEPSTRRGGQGNA
jgi:hypothetical protein